MTKTAIGQLGEEFVADYLQQQNWQILEKRGNLSDETMTLEDLKSLNLQSFHEMLPFLERLEEADLAQRLPQAYATVYEPILISSNPTTK